MNRCKIFLILVIVITIFSVILKAKENNSVKRNDLEITPVNRTDGTVDFQVRTISYNGAYAPAHCLAIWVCDENDNFVRTLVRRAWFYIQHLVKWNQMTNGDDTNALITGASPNVHTTWTFNWDCRDRFNNMVPDGNYKVYVEFTEDNSTLIPVNGPWTMVEFTKGDQVQTIEPAGDQFFQDLFLEYNPTGPSYPDIVITSPAEGEEITELPLIILFDLENFPLDSGSINLYINNEFILQHAGVTGIPIYDLPVGEVELALKLFNAQGQPFNPPAEDFVDIIYNPSSYSQESIYSVITNLDNFPNPFNPTTTISFSLNPENIENTEVVIYNIKGHKVKSFAFPNGSLGTSDDLSFSSSTTHSLYKVTWDGTDENQQPVPSGVYFYKLKSGDYELTRKMLLLK